MNPFTIFFLGGLLGMMFKDTIKSGLRSVAKTGMKTAMELSEEMEDMKAEMAESEQRPAPIRHTKAKNV